MWSSNDIGMLIDFIIRICGFLQMSSNGTECIHIAINHTLTTVRHHLQLRPCPLAGPLVPLYLLIG